MGISTFTSKEFVIFCRASGNWQCLLHPKHPMGPPGINFKALEILEYLVIYRLNMGNLISMEYGIYDGIKQIGCNESTNYRPGFVEVLIVCFPCSFLGQKLSGETWVKINSRPTQGRNMRK